MALENNILATIRKSESPQSSITLAVELNANPVYIRRVLNRLENRGKVERVGKAGPTGRTDFYIIPGQYVDPNWDERIVSAPVYIRWDQHNLTPDAYAQQVMTGMSAAFITDPVQDKIKYNMLLLLIADIKPEYLRQLNINPLTLRRDLEKARDRIEQYSKRIDYFLNNVAVQDGRASQAISSLTLDKIVETYLATELENAAINERANITPPVDERPVPPENTDNKCTACEGKGFTNGTVCNTCKGRGRIT